MESKLVLLVDDDVGLPDIYRITPEGEGFEVLTVENGDEAMRIASSKPIKPADLVATVRTLASGWTFPRQRFDRPRLEA